jgi:hypothetical protein
MSSMMLSSKVIESMERSMKEVVRRYVKDCCEANGLNVEEELKRMNIDNLKIVEKSSKKVEKVKKVKKIVIPMPFSKSLIKEEGCCGLSYNHGLFTQCEKSKMSNGSYCVTCQSEGDKNTSGEPNNGTITERVEKELYEFKDPKGRKAISYLKVLEKLKLTKEAALTEANRLNIEINEAHLTELVKEKKITRGRPKKSKKIVEAENVTDLFAKLTADVVEEEPTVVEESNEVIKKKKTKLSEEEKEAKKLEKEAKKLEKEAELEAKKEAKKLELEAKKAEREEKRKQEKAEKAAAKKTTKKETKKVAVKEVPKEVVEEAKTPEKVTVTRATINGKQYLKSSNNILYDPESKEEVGLWDAESKSIKELPDDEEEEEEEYEEDN